MNLQYVIGDATNPVAPGNQIIAHCCNDKGFWNAGFVRALSARYHQPERDYRRWAQGNASIAFAVGPVQFVKVRSGFCVANIMASTASVPNPTFVQFATMPSDTD